MSNAITWTKPQPETYGDDIVSTALVDGAEVGTVDAYQFARPRARTWDAFCSKCQKKFIERGDLKMAREFFEEHYHACEGVKETAFEKAERLGMTPAEFEGAVVTTAQQERAV